MSRLLKYKSWWIFFLLVVGMSLPLKSQDKTISTGTVATANTAPKKHKIMIVPFESRMYLSEIDFQINKESKLSAKEIKVLMRDGVNEQLYKKLKTKMAVVDMLEDTVKTKKDLADIYQYLNYQYQKVPNQANYKAPEKEKAVKTIDKGQLNVESNSDARFMNAKIKNASLVPYLYGKYKTDLYLFINELDIKALNGSAADMNLNSSRKIVLHYTVYTYDAKEINSGIAEVDLPVTVNNPNKIINSYFVQLAEILSTRIEKALLPVK
jgi:predicted secreted protein